MKPGDIVRINPKAWQELQELKKRSSLLKLYHVRHLVDKKLCVKKTEKCILGYQRVYFSYV